MTAYAPRHAVTQPRTSRTPLWRRARRMLLSLLPAARVVMAPFADRFPCCAHCTDGAPCEPRDNHLAPCADGCNDPAPLRPTTLTDAEIAALTPTWAVRRDGLITVTAAGDVEVYPSPLAWEPDTRITAAMPVISRTDHAELPAEFDDRPGPEVLQRVLDGLRAIPDQGDWGTMPVADVLAAELPQVIA